MTGPDLRLTPSDSVIHNGSLAQSSQNDPGVIVSGNAFHRNEKTDLHRQKIRKHKAFLEIIPHEYPHPLTKFRIGVYIRYFNQTKYENYLDYHKQQFIDTIGLCPNWQLVDFYVDEGTGMRCGELIGLTWDCIDFDNGTIYIKRQLTQARVAGAPFEFGSLKNGKTRTIMPAPFVMKTLAAHKEDQEKKKKAAGDLWDEGEFPGLVFTRADGSHLSQPTVWKQFQKILKAAGLEHHRVHDLRHTFAVNSIMAGDDIKTLQENMGHYSAAFTLDRYGHVTATMRQASANRMQAFIDAM